MESTINPDDSPFSNLDVWCDWLGNQEDPVSVTISMEAWCGPNFNLPILNAQSPNIVQPPSHVIQPKPEFFEYGDKLPQENENHVPSHRHGDDHESYPTADRTISYSESVIVHDGSRDEDPAVPCSDGSPSQDDGHAPTQDDTSDVSRDVSRHNVDISTMYTQVDSPESITSSNPRKRSAKTASLPDSIGPDDEDHGTQHKFAMTKIDSHPNQELLSQISSIPSIPSTPSTPSKPRKTSSLIPIPTRRIAGSLSESSAPDAKADLSRIKPEPLTASPKKATIEHGLDETPYWHNPQTPPNKIDLSGTEPLTEANLHQRSCDSNSLRVCNGSLSDTENSDKEREILLPSFGSLGSSYMGREPNRVVFSQTRIKPSSAADRAKRNEPTLVLDNGILYLRTPPSIYPGTYQIRIVLKVRLQKGKSKDWWQLVISGLPRLAQLESGYFYLRTPPGQGMEFVTSAFKRHTLVESCLMAQFDGGKSLVTPFRKCSAEYFGYLKDYKVNAVIQAEVVEARDPSSYLIKYNAVCSIDLINHSFWAERCRFYLNIYGGPEGDFDGILDAEKPLINVIHLTPPSDVRIGLSRIDILSIHQALGMFSVVWEVKIPRNKAITWLPWINNASSSSDAESALKEDYTQFKSKHHNIDSEKEKISTPYRASCSRPGTILPPEELPKSLTTATAAPNSLLPGGVCVDNCEFNANSLAENSMPGAIVTKLPITKAPAPRPMCTVCTSMLNASKDTSVAASVAKPTVADIPVLGMTVDSSIVAETPIAKPKETRRAAHALWTMWPLVMPFLQWVSILSSLHVIHCSLPGLGFRFNSVALYASCPQVTVPIYDPMDVERTFNFSELISEIETLRAELDFQHERVQVQNEQGTNSTYFNTTHVNTTAVNSTLNNSLFADVNLTDTTLVNGSPVSLRDRIDYFLGWRGPIERD